MLNRVEQARTTSTVCSIVRARSEVARDGVLDGGEWPAQLVGDLAAREAGLKEASNIATLSRGAGDSDHYQQAMQFGANE